MASDRDGRHVEITEDGQTIAVADFRPSADQNVVRADFHSRPAKCRGNGRADWSTRCSTPRRPERDAKLEATPSTPRHASAVADRRRR